MQTEIVISQGEQCVSQQVACAKHSIAAGALENLTNKVDKEIDAYLRSVVVELLCIDHARIVPEACLRCDLGADSLDLAELIVALGQRFEANIHDAEASQVHLFGQLATYLDEKVVAVRSGVQQEVTGMTKTTLG